MRNELGEIIAVSEGHEAGFDDELNPDDLELAAFVSRLQEDSDSIARTDLEFVRVLDDVVDLLISKGVILFTELPPSAQDKISRRQQLRSELGDQLNLIEED
jgi:hypothetical protein